MSERDIVERLTETCSYETITPRVRSYNSSASNGVVLDAAAEITSLRARVAELEGALQFYADKDNYVQWAGVAYFLPPAEEGNEQAKVIIDYGERARAVLAQALDNAGAQPDDDRIARETLRTPCDAPLRMAAARPAQSPAGAVLWKHKKRGTTYVLIGDAEVQAEESLTEAEIVVVYKAQKDGRLWVRRKSEFYDGRFEALTAALGASEPAVTGG